MSCLVITCHGAFDVSDETAEPGLLDYRKLTLTGSGGSVGQGCFFFETNLNQLEEHEPRSPTYLPT